MRLAALPRRYPVVSLLIGLLSRAVADCNHNNCLRAVIGSAVPTRDGVGDCNSYLLATVTPATSTFYSTSTTVATVLTTTTAVDSYTTVIVIPATTTSTQATTETQYTVDTVTTATTVTTVVEETVTETNTAAAKARRGQRGPMEPRQVTATPTAIPAYASSCPSPAAYVSACLCFGATARTITAAAPSTTITVPTTSYTTSTIFNTISTTSTQSSTSTATIVETDTATSTVVASTTDFTTYTTTSTSTTTTTSTTVTGCPTGIASEPGGGCAQCQFSLYCGSKLVAENDNPNWHAPASPVNYQECVAVCDSNGFCDAVTYDEATGTCTQFLYSDEVAVVPAPGYDSAIFIEGTCQNYGCPSYECPSDAPPCSS